MPTAEAIVTAVPEELAATAPPGKPAPPPSGQRVGLSFEMTGLLPAGLSHSEILGSIPVCESPRLIAAYHVFLRLQEPRHPPYALIYFLTTPHTPY